MSEVGALRAELEERLARYRAGAMNADERLSFEREVLVNDALAEALYGEISLDAVRRAADAGGAQRPAAPVTPLWPARPRSRLGGARFLVPLAASVLVVSALALWPSRPRAPLPGGDWVRGESAMTALEPVGTLASPPERFRWTRDPGAASYRVELYDANANAMGTAVSRDTMLAFASVAHGPLAAGEWRVVAIGPDGLDRPARARASFRISPR